MTPNIWPNSFGLHSFSAGGVGSFYFFKNFKLLIDIGEWHPILETAQHVFLTHGHFDHISNLFRLLSYRRQTLTIYAHPGMLPNIAKACRALEELNGFDPWGYQWQDLAQDINFEIGKNLLMQSIPLVHHKYSNACLIWERRKFLQECYKNLDTKQIQSLVLEGHNVTSEKLSPIIFCSGDTGSDVFQIKEMFEAEVCVLECTFWDDEYRDSAKKWNHLHIYDILDVASQFDNRILLLSHISNRYSIEFIKKLSQKLRNALHKNVLLLLDIPYG
ncbi:hypothetical protein TI05_02675 [Achromatium sp. WMS3]|nr:hypothetical protein TI05_02675 [Achromatium sp. WMS3]